MYLRVVLTSCSVSVNVVCGSPCVQDRAVLLSLVDMCTCCVVECVTCHWVSSGDGVREANLYISVGPHVLTPTCGDPDEPWNRSSVWCGREWVCLSREEWVCLVREEWACLARDEWVCLVRKEGVCLLREEWACLLRGGVGMSIEGRSGCVR